MEQIRAWTLAVCFACIAAGILQQLSSQHGRFSVIKLVLTLYILITAFAPLKSLEQSIRFEVPKQQAHTEAVDTTALVLAQAQRQLALGVEEALAAGGIVCFGAEVQLSQTNAETRVDEVSLQLAAGQDELAAKSIVAQALGTQAPIQIEREG